MGKGKSKQKVPYYYMSLQYGICHGPLDSLNQVSIKDKTVLCGEIVDSTAVYLNKPELFGGETKEGGVRGVMEYYRGDAGQKMTDISASRFGKTKDTMVGYRGVANLFFRGEEEVEREFTPPASTSTNPFIGILYKNKSILDLIAWISSGRPTQTGFLWVTNNPYLPPTWVNVTRLADPFAGPYVSVPTPLDPTAGDDGGFLDFLFAVNFGSGTAYTDFGLASISESVDAGLTVVTFTFSFYSNYVGVGGSGPAPIFGSMQGRMYDGAGVEITQDYPGEGSWFISTVGTVSGGTTLTMTRTVKPGTRTIRIGGTITALYPLYSSSGVSLHSAHINYTTLGPRLCGSETASGSPPNANPALMIAECLTNRQWGMGAPTSTLDMDSFNTAAATLYGEFFGLSMLWSDQMEIEKFIGEILDHIQAMLFTDPTTGLWTLKLIRMDYSVGALRTLTGLNSTISNRQRKAEGEIINEIIISYKDFQTEEDKTVTFHDLAGIAQLGQIVSETRNYYGIRSDALANFVGGRDIRTASYPIFSADVEADKSFRNVRPGDVLKMDVPEDGIVGMIVRVAKVDYGQPGASKVSFAVSEDIFGLPSTKYTVAQRSLWQSDTAYPLPLTAQRAIEAPLPMLYRSGVNEADLLDSRYPEVITALFGDSHTQDVQTITIWGDEVSPSGAVTQQPIGTIDRTTYGTLATALTQSVTSSMPGLRIRAAAGAEEPVSGSILYLDGTNAAGEFIMLNTYNSGTDVWTVIRGLYDTVPKAWPVDTVFWFIDTSMTTFDPTNNAAGVPTVFRLLPRTNSGLLDAADALQINHTPVARPYLPFRPADTKINGNSFGVEAHYDSAMVGGIPATIPVTWANRNRTLEDGVATRWTDATVTAELGQTTRIRVLERFSQILQYEWAGLAGASFAMPTASLIDYRFYDVQFLSDRDGFTCLQYATLQLEIARLGYGNNYGYDYGENNG